MVHRQVTQTITRPSADNFSVATPADSCANFVLEFAVKMLEGAGEHTICPETITDLISFQFPRCKNYVSAPEIIKFKLLLSKAQFARNYCGTEITDISCKNYGTPKQIQDNFCDVTCTLRRSNLIVQKNKELQSNSLVTGEHIEIKSLGGNFVLQTPRR